MQQTAVRLHVVSDAACAAVSVGSACPLDSHGHQLITALHLLFLCAFGRAKGKSDQKLCL